LKSEWWGESLVQEEKYQGKGNLLYVNNNDNNNSNNNNNT